MAIPSWITLNKKSGTGDDTVTVTASPNHTGAQRSTTLTFTGGGITRIVSVTQDYSKNVDVNLDTVCTIPLGTFNPQYVYVYLLYKEGPRGNNQRKLIETLEYTGQEHGTVPLQGECSLENTDGISILGFSVSVSQAGMGYRNFSTVSWTFDWFYNGTAYKFAPVAQTLVWSGTYSDTLDFYFQSNATIEIAAGQAETLNLSSPNGGLNLFA